MDIVIDKYVGTAINAPDALTERDCDGCPYLVRGIGKCNHPIWKREHFKEDPNNFTFEPPDLWMIKCPKKKN